MAKNRTPDFTNIPVHAGASFSWEGRDGTTDASMLTNGGRKAIAGQVWNDSVDLGFYVQSPRTGTRILFILNEEQTREGEVVGWRYVSHGTEEPLHLLVVNT